MKHSHVETNGISLHVVEHGMGPLVLFCHGFPDTWRGWRRQMEAVATAGYRAVAVDMRGYGESSAPNNAALYTPLHTVGDLVGLLDTLGVNQATIVGHDFGAVTAWNAAMMRPDRFTAVFGISVPFQPRGAESLLQRFRRLDRNEFYIFHKIRPEADLEWADAAVTIPGALYWASASPPRELRWSPFDPLRRLNRASPVYCPEWADQADVALEIAEFQRTGFHGPLNYYRAIEPYFQLSSAFSGMRIMQPSFFLIGKVDGVNEMRVTKEEELRRWLPNLRGFAELDDVGHWPQLEATNAVNAALLRFLAEVR